MITLDDVIEVKHLIVCRFCAVSAFNKYDAVFMNMKSWLEHIENTGHKKDSHSVAIIGNDFEVVYTFNPPLI